MSEQHDPIQPSIDVKSSTEELPATSQERGKEIALLFGVLLLNRAFGLDGSPPREVLGGVRRPRQ